MKKTGKCPKCGSTEIYTDAKQLKRGDRCIIPVTSWKTLYLNTYLCTSCGFIEEYTEKIGEKELEKIKENWSRMY